LFYDGFYVGLENMMLEILIRDSFWDHKHMSAFEGKCRWDLISKCPSSLSEEFTGI